MLILDLWRLLRARARRSAHARPMRATLATLDPRTLADIGIGPGAIVSLAREVGIERLRRAPHV
jgi:Domain of unknown function (DUF1127)